MSTDLHPAGKPMRLRYAGTCQACHQSLAAGSHAYYDRAARAVSCQDCAAAAPVVAGAEAPPLVLGPAGGSAQAEHDRIRAAREQRARDRYGRLGAFASAISDDTPQEKAWAKGARGERIVGERLEARVPSGVLLLHDRRLPASRANIDHLALGPGGITVIDAKNLKGEIRSKVSGGILRARTEQLLIAGRDRTSLIDGLQKQLTVVEELVGPEVDVCGCLCLADASGLPWLGGVSVYGLPVLGVKATAKLASRPGPLTDEQVTALHGTLAGALRPAS